MTAIVVSVYGGYDKHRALAKPMDPLFLPDETIGAIGLNLPDSEFEVFQKYQLTPEYFSSTHARLLRIVSLYINHLKLQFPLVPIILEGRSFGGFFATSYALLQSVMGTDTFDELYEDFAQQGLRENFPDCKITPIDQVISNNGWIEGLPCIARHKEFLNCYGGTYKRAQWSKHIKIPTFMQFAYHDGRVSFDNNMASMDAFPDEAVQNSSFITLYVARGEKHPSFLYKELLDDEDDANKILVGKYVTTTLGHNTRDKHLNECLVDFVRHGSKYAHSKLHQAIQQRAFNIFGNQNAGVIGFRRLDQKDILRFLSNLRNTQQYLETKMKEGNGGPLTREQIIKHHMDRVNTGIILEDLCENYFREPFEREILQNLELNPEGKNLFSFWRSDYNLHAVLKILRKQPRFDDSYFGQKQKHHTILMKIVTTQGIWKQAIRKVINQNRMCKYKESMN